MNVQVSKLKDPDGETVATKYEKPQSELTSDCWLIQFQGLEACVKCDYYKTNQCGGGETLAKIINSKAGLSIMEQSEIGKFFNDPDIQGKGFKGLLDYLNNSDILGIVRLEKYYDKQVKKIKARLNEKQAKIRLPEKYPFNKVYNNGKVIHQEGYHYINRKYFSCSCSDITDNNASYRDIIIKLNNGTLIYYIHQNPILAREKNQYILDTCNYRTKLTKNRLNRYLPRNQGHILTEGEKWYLTNPKPKTKPAINYQRFFDGITIKRYNKYDYTGGIKW